MLIALFCSFNVNAQNEVFDSVRVNMVDDTTLLDSFSIANLDSNNVDSVITQDSLRPTKRMMVSNQVKSTVNYNARDSIIMEMTGQKAYLYGDAHVDFENTNLDAAYIEIDWVKNEVYARGMPDSSGKDTIGLPVFKEGNDEFVSKEMRYNFNTEKGIIKEVVTQEGDGYIHGKTVKMNEKKELFVGDAVYTTCNLEHPHFAIVSKKIKVVPDKVAVTGPFNLQIADIKTPIGGPFGLFPLPDENVSGIIMPQPGENSNGFFLRNGGYYLNIKDHVGIRITGDIYTNASWRLKWDNTYVKRYSYNGNLLISLARNKRGFDKTDDIPLDYKLAWKHSPKGNPDGKISSSVNIQSSSYNQNNEFNVNRTLANNFNSSISYSKQLGNSPFRLTVALRQSQVDSTQNYTLPDVAFNMRRIQPFKALKGPSGVWYKQIGIGYTMTAKNTTTNKIKLYDINGNPTGEQRHIELDFLDANTFTQNSKNGIKHSIPLTLPSFKLMKHFTLTPTVAYNEYWYGKKLDYTLIDSINSYKEEEVNGFSRAYDYQFSTKLNTRMYGYLNVPLFALRRIKHTMTPSISYTYKPDFSDTTLFGQKFYQTVRDTSNDVSQLSRYDGFVYGGPSKGEQQTLAFSLSNVFDARVQSKKDTTGKPKYIKLLDNFNASTSYNIAKDSLKWSNLSLNARTTVSGISLNVRSTHDYYAFKQSRAGAYYRVNEFAIKNGRFSPRLTSLNTSASTDLNPKKRNKLKKLEPKESDSELERLEKEQIKENIDSYVDFDIPWNLNINYNLDWRQAFTKEDRVIIQSVRMRGDLSLTPKWKFTFSNAGYDITNKKILPLNVGIVRDLHCWDMRFSYQPFGLNKGFMFDISVKSATLQGLKLSKQDDPRNR